ncbi:hypothetical protein [Streptomyces sp. NRRL F-5727]|uniref:hypothetical protein n=1 Tax=Streptomyces sp. NRRL F-5727 TaxID=1463871 RepID=UPI00068A3A83|nr:hypothetical protein [Streptomyces sp. NRRL F-5727]
MADRDLFRIGPLRTPYYVYEGDGTRPIKEENLQVYYEPDTFVHVPADVLRWRQEIEDEQETRAVAGLPQRWNHPNFALETIAVTRTDRHEDPIVELRFSPADYFTFLASQQLDRRLEEGEGVGLTLREHYLDGKDPVAVNGFLSSSFGANVIVVSEPDDTILVSRRSATVGMNPNRWNSSANEGMSGVHDLKDGVPDLFGAARRALREELGIRDDEHRLELLSFGMDTQSHQWAGCFRAVLPELGEAELRDRWSRGVDDKWEHSRYAFVPARPDGLLDFMLDPENIGWWASGAPAFFYHALVRTMVERTGSAAAGRAAVEAAIAPAIRRAEARRAEAARTE